MVHKTFSSGLLFWLGVVIGWGTRTNQPWQNELAYIFSTENFYVYYIFSTESFYAHISSGLFRYIVGVLLVELIYFHIFIYYELSLKWFVLFRLMLKNDYFMNQKVGTPFLKGFVKESIRKGMLSGWNGSSQMSQHLSVFLLLYILYFENNIVIHG